MTFAEPVATEDAEGMRIYFFVAPRKNRSFTTWFSMIHSIVGIQAESSLGDLTKKLDAENIS